MKLRYIIALLIAFGLMSAACGTVADPTTVPTTTVPTTTVPTKPAATVPVTVEADGMAACEPSITSGVIDLDNVSSFEPESWDDWCDGFTEAVGRVYDLDEQDRDELCAEFAGNTDQEVLDYATGIAGGTRDKAIGVVDFLHTLCF
jgi:hypothetical protein